MKEEYLGHGMIQEAPDDPISIFTSTGNLLGTAETVREARRLIIENRIREVAKELYDLTNLR